MRTVSQQSGLAKKITLAQDGDDLWLGVRFCRFQDFYFAFFDNTKESGRLALSLDEIAWTIVSVVDLLRRIGIKEAEIAREEQVPCPVHGHLDSARPRRQLEEIDSAPQEPGEETRDAHPEHFCDGLVTAD